MVNKFNISMINTQIKKKYDLFLCCASFEERCMSIVRNICANKINKSIIFYTEEMSDYSKENRESMISLLSGSYMLVGLKQSNPIDATDQMIITLRNVKEAQKVRNILFDMTTFTHEFMLIMTRLITEIFPVAEITYAYTNAAEYDSDNENDHKWLSKGIGEIRSVLGYPGNTLPTQKTHLIVIVGYEYERALQIINSVEPSKLSLGFGKSGNATTEKNKEANEHFMHLVERMSASYSAMRCFEVMCNDPFETCKIIENEVSGTVKMNTVIVPLNNKITTLGAAFAAIRNEDIQLCYAPALIYNFKNYSTPGESCYFVRDEYNEFGKDSSR